MTTLETQVSYPGDGSTRQWNLTFPYIAQEDISVTINDATAPFTWISDTRIQTVATAAVGQTVTISRHTASDELITEFQDGSTPTAEDLNSGITQVFYIAQEIVDTQSQTLTLNDALNFDGQTKILQNLANGVSSQDAVTLGQVLGLVVSGSAITFPSLSGAALKYLQVNAGATGYQHTTLGALAAKTTVGTADIDAVSITNSKMAANSVDTSQLLAGAVTNAKLATNAVATANVTDGSITDAKLSAPRFPTRYRGTAAPVYVSTSSFSVAFIYERDGTDAVNMAKSTSTTVSTATTGAAALDAGTVANNTWYYLYAITKSSDGTTSLILSTVNESVTGSITLPSGYTHKRQLKFACRTNGSAQIIEFVVAEGWPFRPLILYNVTTSSYSGSFTNGTTNVLAAGNATSFTSVSCTSYIPPISTLGLFCWNISAGGLFSLGPAGTSANRTMCGGTDGGGEIARDYIITDSSQAIEYKKITGTTTMNVDTVGFVINKDF